MHKLPNVCTEGSVIRACFFLCLVSLVFLSTWPSLHELAANCASERFLSQDVIGFVDYVLVPSVNGEQENRVQKGNGYFQVPPHTPVIFGEAGGRTLFR